MRLTSRAEQWDIDQRRSIRAKEKPAVEASPPIRVSIVATPEAMVSPVSGLFETFQAAGSMVAPEERGGGRDAPFEVEIVAERGGTVEGPSGLTIGSVRAVRDVDRTDIVIVPSMAIGEVDWVQGRYPEPSPGCERCTSAAQRSAPPAPAAC